MRVSSVGEVGLSCGLPEAGSRGGVLVLGNFDGVHRGHQAVVKAALTAAQSLRMRARALTLEPHPRTLFQPDGPPFRLTPEAMKRRLLLALGLEGIVTLPFTQELAHLEAQAFVEAVLIKHYGAEHVVAGADFVFGHGRAGTMAKLRAWLEPYKVGVTEVQPVGEPDSTQTFSSSRTRSALEAGDVDVASRLLGRPWSIAGTVIEGARRGKKLGFPTANMMLGDHLRPRFGVYAVQARRWEDKAWIPGVANIGKRPTVGGKEERLEAHLFDFDGDLYGEIWEIALQRFLRPEQQFASLEALREQIVQDAAAARDFLAVRTA